VQRLFYPKKDWCERLGQQYPISPSFSTGTVGFITLSGQIRGQAWRIRVVVGGFARRHRFCWMDGWLSLEGRKGILPSLPFLSPSSSHHTRQLCRCRLSKVITLAPSPSLVPKIYHSLPLLTLRDTSPLICHHPSSIPNSYFSFLVNWLRYDIYHRPPPIPFPSPFPASLPSISSLPTFSFRLPLFRYSCLWLHFRVQPGDYFYLLDNRNHHIILCLRSFHERLIARFWIPQEAPQLT